MKQPVIKHKKSLSMEPVDDNYMDEEELKKRMADAKKEKKEKSLGSGDNWFIETLSAQS